MAFLSTPLDEALNSTSKIRLLRLLIEQDRTVSAREAARLTRMSNPAILGAIADLAELGLIVREQSGRQFLCRANYAHKLVEIALKPLFAAETAWPELLFDAIRRVLASGNGSADEDVGPSHLPRARVIAAWIFGSVARGQDEPESDLDLFVLTRTTTDATWVSERIAEAGSRWAEEFGADLRPVIMTLDNALSQHERGGSLIRNAITHARMVVGEIPQELRDGQADEYAARR